ADFGAEVVKIERPEVGDDTRAWGPPFIEGESAYFLSVNREKKSLTLNLKSDKGREIFKKLARDADVVLENFRPGTVKKLGVDFETLRKLNPKLIYCSISGFGQNGPYRKRPGYDQILQGLGGLMSITGEEKRPPVKVGVAITDIAAGMFGAYAVLLALFHRERFGEGQYIDCSMLDCQVSWLTYQAFRYFATGKVPEKVGSGHPLIVPYQAFKAKDRYINIACGNDLLFKKFCKVIEREELFKDERFRTNPQRIIHRRELIDILSEIIKRRDGDFWFERLSKAGIPCGQIYDMADIFSDPQVLSRGMLLEVQHEKCGKLKLIGVPVKLSKTPGSVELPPPMLGEHTNKILGDLEYSGEEIENLRREGVV
ncbi:MAG: CaiB/BaiF CoA transferase family protein, partial [Candidatus Methanofastidiosia archaeon]